MNKKLIRLTESDLHKIVKESVNRILNERVHNLHPDEINDDFLMIGKVLIVVMIIKR